MSLVSVFSGWVSSAVDAPWLVTALVKITIVLLVAWVIHFLLRQTNPRWRVVLWRSAIVGVIAVASLDGMRIAALSWEVASPVAAELTQVSESEVTLPSNVLSNAVTAQAGSVPGVYVPAVYAVPQDDFWVASQSQVSTPSSAADAALQPSLGSAWAIEDILLTGWIAGLCLLTLRWLIGTIRVHAIVRHASPPPTLVQEQANVLQRELAVGRCRTVQAAIQGSPFLCMTLSGPVVVIPESITSSADREEIRAILIHELSHLRSGDLVWNRIVRVVMGLLWPHPFAWRIGSTHLQACEDAADAESARRIGEAELYSQTLAKVALTIRRGQRPVGLAMARASDVRRRIDRVKQTFRLLPLTPRQITVSVATASFVFLLLGTFRLVGAQPPVQENVKKDAAEVAENAAEEKEGERSLTVRIGDEQGQVVAGVEFNAWYNAEKIEPEQIDEGVYEVVFPDDAQFLRLEVKAPQRVPQVATWREEETKTELEDTFEFRLPLGRSISGHVFDEAGEPIEGATISVLDASGAKDRVRPQHRVYRYEVQTDASGRWVCDVMPAEFSEVWLKLSHPDYASDSMFGATAGQVPVDQLIEGTHRMVLKKGVTVKGKIVDTSGNPIEGATVYQGSDRFGSDYPETKSDAAGEFAFPHSKLGQMILTIAADTFAPELREVDVTEDFEPIEVVLPPGKTLRLRTVDAAGDPLPGVMIVADTWRGHRSLVDAMSRQKSDEQGRFVWKNAPEDEVAFDMLAKGYLDKRRSKLSASDEEQVITFLPPLSVTATVVDAKTKQPIDEFEIIEGFQFTDSDQNNWERQRSKRGRSGAFEKTFDYPRQGHLLRIEAIGYVPAISRMIRPDEGSISLSFELEPSEPLRGVVTTSEGKPAADAQVVVALASQYVRIVNGRLSDVEDQLMATTDAQGRFELPSQAEAFRLLFLHESGAKLVAGNEFATGQSVTLLPWATIHGTVRIGEQPAAQTDVVLHHIDSAPYDQPRFSIEGHDTTDDQGKFVLQRVLPAEKFSVQRVIPRKPQGTVFSHTVQVATQPGGDHEVAIGGDGRPVVWRVVVPETDAKYNWGFNVIMPDTSKFAFPQEVDEMSDEEKQQWYDEWSKTDEGIAHAEKQARLYAVVVEEDNAVRVEDIPAGDYTLSMSINAATANDQCGFGESLGNLVHRFTVPEMPNGRSDEPLDLGELTLKLRQFVSVGDAAPALSAKTVDGESVELADYAGKYVLLDFWATWCAPCLAEMPNLKKLQTQYAGDDRLVIIGLSLDADSETVSDYLSANSMPWTQLHLGDSSDVQSDYGVQSIPATFLIGPDGTIIAKDVRGDELIKTINEKLVEK